jgi:carbon monoxide dehydrogenase subunit G
VRDEDIAMFTSSTRTRAGGRFGARRLIVLSVVAASLMPAPPLSGADGSMRDAEVKVTETSGVYTVSACFRIPQTAAVVLGVLSDYEAIPRFMPGVKTSIILAREAGRATVQQEAVSRFMMFSKRVHLLLDITETPDKLVFRDRSGRSFRRYEGAWTIAERDGGTQVNYELVAEPAFDVPQMILKRLLGRDAGAMIDGLREEMAARAVRGAHTR